jgi:hypothetical protein
MTLYNDNNTVRKFDRCLKLNNAIHPGSGERQTVEGCYHVPAFNQAYKNMKESDYSLGRCVSDLAQVLLEVNTHLSREDEPRDVTLARAKNMIEPEFQAFIDFRDLGDDEDFIVEFTD